MLHLKHSVTWWYGWLSVYQLYSKSTCRLCKSFMLTELNKHWIWGAAQGSALNHNQETRSLLWTWSQHTLCLTVFTGVCRCLQSHVVQTERLLSERPAAHTHAHTQSANHSARLSWFIVVCWENLLRPLLFWEYVPTSCLCQTLRPSFTTILSQLSDNLSCYSGWCSRGEGSSLSLFSCF